MHIPVNGSDGVTAPSHRKTEKEEKAVIKNLPQRPSGVWLVPSSRLHKVYIPSLSPIYILAIVTDWLSFGFSAGPLPLAPLSTVRRPNSLSVLCTN